MSDGKTTLATAANTQLWDQKLIFSILADQARFGLLLTLARKGPQTAAALIPPGTRSRMLSLNRIVKRLGRLQKAGLVVVMSNPVDGRKQLYGLAPGITVKNTELGSLLDLTFCLLRV